MFKDYYHILEIQFGASPEQIKSAFKKQAFLWHPDKNPNLETKERMQDINEAHLILKDSEARKRYNAEYERYQSFIKLRKETVNNENQSSDYQFYDDTLKKWMSNARMQAAELVSQTFKEFKTGAKAAWEEMVKQFIAFSIIGIIFLIIARGCG